MADLTALPEYRAYVRAREAVLRMKGATHPASAPFNPSAYWAEELENIDYLLDASPLIVRKLRHHAFHITSLRPYDYRSKGDRRRELFEARMQALRELDGRGLLVPESRALGGFGFDIDGSLYNVDTLKFYEVLIGMEHGGVLDTMRGKPRPVICEIGAGWGGFAYQFKTLFPRSAYVIVDFAELFLFSATYLATVFPDARILFCVDETLDRWEDADFVFVPHTERDLVSRLPLDLTVNMVSFQEMTDAQVHEYAKMAADAHCPFLYSLNRERSAYNNELTSVSGALSEYYALDEVAILDTDYTSAMKKAPRSSRPVERTEFNYRHNVGRLVASAGAAVASTADATRSELVAGPRVVLGMTLHNNARALPEAMESLLAQTYRDFLLVLLDDASSDATEVIACGYVQRDRRVRYFRHETRQAMIATWREVVDIAARECPSATMFAWVSDHDRWHASWLERMVGELDADPEAVLAYPITRRVEQSGDEVDKGPRFFDTSDCVDLDSRWNRFCRQGVGAGDMVYGVMRLSALRRAGVFRMVLRPDRLLMAELTLQGRIRQVREVLWLRRRSEASSIDRQHQTLVLPGQEPPWFGLLPWLQHGIVLWREYVQREPRPLPLSRRQWLEMLALYQITYGWRHLRKTSASHAYGRAMSRLVRAKKLTKHYFHRAMYETLVHGRLWWGLMRRALRRGIYHVLVGRRVLWTKTRRGSRRLLYYVLVFTHRIGLRGGGQATP